MSHDKRKIALVTGGSKGIGAAIALALARAGYDIWLNYRNDHQGASAVARSIEEAGCTCTLLPFDVADASTVSSRLDPLLEAETPFVLVNNAGFAKDTLLLWMGEQEWNEVISVALNGFFNVTKKAINGMLRKREGRIINIVSTSAQSGMAGQVNYAAAKAGLIGATKSLAAEVAKRNVLVNAIAPGFIETDMTADVPKEKVVSKIPLGRFGTVREVADVAVFLCSNAATYITGQVISVNGGVYM
jgi:3-oxoacyl-[acyl-carrier protein] reductase